MAWHSFDRVTCCPAEEGPEDQKYPKAPGQQHPPSSRGPRAGHPSLGMRYGGSGRVGAGEQASLRGREMGLSVLKSLRLKGSIRGEMLKFSE